MSGAFLAVVVVTAAFLIFVTSRMKSSGEQLQQSINSIRAAEELQVHLLNHNREEFLYALTKSETHGANRDEERRLVVRWLDEAKKYISSGEEQILYNEVVETFRTYHETRERLSERMPPIEAYRQANDSLSAAFVKAEALTNFNLREARELQAKLSSDDILANWFGAIIAFLAIIVFPISLFFVRRLMYGPIINLHKSIRSFSGTNHAKIPEHGFEEIREISKAFNELSYRLGEQKRFQLRFLAAVAHDLRNPLAAIKMSAQLMAEREVAKEDKPILDIISRQTEQLNRMVGDLLDSTRIESGELELQIKSQELVSLIKDSVELHRAVSRIHRIDLICQHDEIICACDPIRIGQVINNLLSNAIKYSPNGGVIRVEVGTEGTDALIKVSDQGIGIAEADREKIFEPFRRTQLTKMSIPGVGLGLSVVKRIVTAHHGEIHVTSVPDQGSTFSIRVPGAEPGPSGHKRIESSPPL